ncbi:MAG: phenylalanine 4-monooxygenase [Bacteroidetes bacterium]|nr:phenylalanine 4-monooxygenase [Bacteroidota bacterium]
MADETPIPNESEDFSKSAYAKYAEQEDIDPRCIPIKLDGDVPEHEAITYPDYPAHDHETWKTLYSRQAGQLPGRACEEYLEGMRLLGLQPDHLPALRDISLTLDEMVGWRIARIPGLLDTNDFFSFMARAHFPSTDYIRQPHELEYTPAPDCFHDIFGHMPTLTNPFFSSFFQYFAQTFLRVSDPKEIRQLERFYWFTVEFGLINTPEGRRIYGAGILSSPKEVLHSLSDAVEVIDFTPERLGTQEYEVWHLQPILFAIESFEQLESEFRAWAQFKGWDR